MINTCNYFYKYQSTKLLFVLSIHSTNNFQMKHSKILPMKYLRVKANKKIGSLFENFIKLLDKNSMIELFKILLLGWETNSKKHINKWKNTLLHMKISTRNVLSESQKFLMKSLANWNFKAIKLFVKELFLNFWKAFNKLNQASSMKLFVKDSKVSKVKFLIVTKANKIDQCFWMIFQDSCLW